ncbi:hypothetical protein J437_LFUL017673 [Ladona fulva]|uniref:Uncharacterized protein n=1 Tax=Ladona fulva TaxID=123851 RepID=A0A8K0KS63_LADFU|nr:hypothetical protein J437_LFUL017673 [Ladona fulva]
MSAQQLQFMVELLVPIIGKKDTKFQKAISVHDRQYKAREFNARRLFKFGILCVRAMVRLKKLRFTPEPLSVAVAQVDPYRVKALRKVR